MKEDFWFEILRPGDVGPPWRQELEVVFVLEGSGLLEIEGQEISYRIEKTDFFAIHPFRLRSIELNPGGLAISLMISTSFITALAPEVKQPTVQCKSFLQERNEQEVYDILRRDFARIFHAQYKKDRMLSIHMRGSVAVLLDDLFAYCLVSTQENSGECGRERLRLAVEYIHTHYAKNITLKELAECTFLSPTYLSRSFAKYLGMPFTIYLSKVRLKKAVALLGTKETVTDIAYQTGFASSNAFIEAFKQTYGVTPGQYRRKQGEKSVIVEDNKTEEGFSSVFASLLSYAEDIPTKESVKPLPATLLEARVSVNHGGKLLQPTWRRIINVGYAKDVLNERLQKQIAKIQEEVGYSYIRCKGILDDDMLLYTKDIFGKKMLSYVYLDEVIDFVLSNHAKPMLEFGHMPAILAAHQIQTFRRAFVIAPPTDYEEWKQLIETVMEHLLNRYGLQEIESWLFSCWVTPEFHDFGLFSLEEYKATYKTTYQAIKQMGSNIKVCGAGIGITNYKLLEWFLDMAKEENCVPDILTSHSFAAIGPEEEETSLKLIENNEAFHMAVSGDERYLARNEKRVKLLLEEKGLVGIPILLDEWNNNVWQRDLCNDTCYKSAYLFKSILENQDRFYGMGYFCLGDQLDEIAPATELFCGGFGLFLKNGMPKSAYQALVLLAKMGSHLLGKGDGWFVTEKRGEIQIFLYHYAHYDMLYRYRHTHNLSKTKRYQVFHEVAPKAYHINIEGMSTGSHRMKQYGISPKGGSTFDEWIAMGAPEPLNKEETGILWSKVSPSYQSRRVEAAEATLCVKAVLQPHEVQLLVIEK